MSGRLVPALFVVLLGALTMLGPYFIFPVCPGAVLTANGGAIPMKCFWTARAALGCGGLIVFAGLLLTVAKTPGVRLGLALMLMPVGLLVAAFPYALIGVCGSEMMPCRLGTLPALCLLDGLTFLVGLGIALSARKAMAASARRAARATSVEHEGR